MGVILGPGRNNAGIVGHIYVSERNQDEHMMISKQALRFLEAIQDILMGV